jgi:hypothetical protein
LAFIRAEIVTARQGDTGGIFGIACLLLADE